MRPFTPHLTFDHERTRPSPLHSAMAGLAVFKKMELPESIQEIEEYDVRLVAVSGFIRFCNEDPDHRPLQFFGPFGVATRVTYWEHPTHGVSFDPVTGDLVGMHEGNCPDLSDRRGGWKNPWEERISEWEPGENGKNEDPNLDSHVETGRENS